MPRPPKRKRGRPRKSGLTPKQELLVAKYFECDFNQQKAAIAAGYVGSPQARSELFRNPVLQAAIKLRQAEAKAKYEAKYELNEDWVIQRLMRIADGSLADILLKLQASGNDLAALTEQERYFLDEFTDEVTTGREGKETRKFKVKGADRLKALDMLSRKLGLYKDTLTHEIGDSITERLQRGRLRAAQPIMIEGEKIE